MHTIYNVSNQDLIDIWIETMHGDDFVVVIWDALTHIERIKKEGFLVNKEDVYDNKILTILVDNIENSFYIMKVLSTRKEEFNKVPFIQVYGLGKFITDNI